MATVKAKAPKCPEPEEYTTWCCTTGAAEFYRLLLRHPLVVCCGAAYRVWELALHNRHHPSWLYETCWALWQLLLLPLFPLAIVPQLWLLGSTVVADMGGAFAAHAINQRVELTFLLDAATRFYRGGCEAGAVTDIASKRFWVGFFTAHGAATTETFGFVDAATALPQYDLVAKEDCSLYGIGTTVLRWRAAEGKFLVCEMSREGGAERLLGPEAALAKLKKWPRPRLLQRFVVPCAHLGTHALRLSTVRVGGGDAALSYAYFTKSEGNTTAQDDGKANVAYYRINWEAGAVGDHIANGSARPDLPGTALPGLDRAVELALQLHKALPACAASSIGWDVALTDDRGPTFFEGNTSPGCMSGMLTWRSWFAPEYDDALVRLCRAGSASTAVINWDAALTQTERSAEAQRLHNTGRSQPTGEGEDTARVPTSFVRACE